MYCNKCGRNLGDLSACPDCDVTFGKTTGSGYDESSFGASTDGFYSVPYNTEPINTMPEPKNRMYGFGAALTSIILSFVAYIFAYVGLVMGTVEPISFFVASVFATPLTIVSIVLGIKSIKVFIARKATCAKPIATLICGIVGLGWAAVAALLGFIGFWVAAMMINI